MVILLALHFYILSGILVLIHDICWLLVHEWDAVEAVRIRQTRNRRQG